MKVYNYNFFTGEYVGESSADQSPLEQGVFLIPANATTIAPPAAEENKTINFENGVWVLKDIPVPEPEPESEPAPLTYAQKRAAEYPFFGEYVDGVVKGDQAQIDKYIADCLAVKAKYPKE
jgi:hypothetical protein